MGRGDLRLEIRLEREEPYVGRLLQQHDTGQSGASCCASNPSCGHALSARYEGANDAARVDAISSHCGRVKVTEGAE